MSDVTIFHNPRCSKSRAALALLEERGIDPVVIEYLKDSPSRSDLERIMGLLGIDDPRGMMRTSEDAYRQLDLVGANRDELLDAMAANPILIERPIVVRGDRAVIGRPTERVRELLSS